MSTGNVLTAIQSRWFSSRNGPDGSLNEYPANHPIRAQNKPTTSSGLIIRDVLGATPYKHNGADSQPAVSILDREHTTSQNAIIVRMTIEVDYKEHSHFIGLHGVKVRRINSITGAKVQFPGNRNPSKEKSNTVTLVGTIHAVEQARAYIRTNFPVVLSFAVPYMTVKEATEFRMKRELLDLQSKFEILVRFYCSSVNKKTYCRVFGTEANSENVSEAVFELIAKFHWPQVQGVCQTKLFWSPTLQEHVSVKRRSPLWRLASYTNTRVICNSNNNDLACLPNNPNKEVNKSLIKVEGNAVDDLACLPNNPNKEVNKSLIKVEGNAVDVLRATKLMKSLLLVELKLEVPEDKYSGTKILQVMASHCSVRVEPCRRQVYVVILKCCEYYICELYEAYRLLMGNEKPKEVFNYNDPNGSICAYFRSLEPLM